MQAESPYRYTHMLGACQVGKAWAAVDKEGQFATVAVLDGAAAADERWRAAFGAAANALAQAAGGHPYADADLSAAHPWVAYRANEGHAPQRLFQSLGLDYQPVPDLPVSAPPASAPPAPAPPVSGVPQQVSGPPTPVSGTPELVEHPPQLPWAMHAAPTSGQPVSASPQPVSAAPSSPASTQPVSATPQAPVYTTSAEQVSPFDPFPTSGGRRIAPVAPKPRRPNWIFITGAVVLTLVAGTTGFVVGRSGSDGGSPKSTAATLPPYETTQLSINKTKFLESELAPLAEPWLAQASSCAAYDEPAAPKLPADEAQHFFCHYGNAFTHFVLYPTKKEKDAARAYRLQLNLAGGALAPGLRQATRTKGNKSGVEGSYVEYAVTMPDGRTLCGLWWDRDDTNGVTYIEALCKESLAGNWDALRDLWRRGS
ncbi:hypothetical protein AB0C50_00080 [Micromonospora taraxaci]|uniref:hypothetical protein n=1 Tax=Micromonospora taraxaci TaxID=1316803 RepID=UPI0033FDD309